MNRNNVTLFIKKKSNLSKQTLSPKIKTKVGTLAYKVVGYAPTVIHCDFVKTTLYSFEKSQ